MMVMRWRTKGSSARICIDLARRQNPCEQLHQSCSSSVPGGFIGHWHIQIQDGIVRIGGKSTHHFDSSAPCAMTGAGDKCCRVRALTTCDCSAQPATAREVAFCTLAASMLHGEG